MTGKAERRGRPRNPNGRPKRGTMLLKARVFFFPDEEGTATGKSKMDRYLWLLRDHKIKYKVNRDQYEFKGEVHPRIEILVDQTIVDQFKLENGSRYMEGDYE